MKSLLCCAWATRDRWVYTFVFTSWDSSKLFKGLFTFIFLSLMDPCGITFHSCNITLHLFCSTLNIVNLCKRCSKHFLLGLTVGTPACTIHLYSLLSETLSKRIYCCSIGRRYSRFTIVVYEGDKASYEQYCYRNPYDSVVIFSAWMFQHTPDEKVLNRICSIEKTHTKTNTKKYALE